MTRSKLCSTTMAEIAAMSEEERSKFYKELLALWGSAHMTITYTEYQKDWEEEKDGRYR